MMLAAKPYWNSVADGLARTSCSPIARACPYDSSASAVLPVALCRRPMMLWLAAKSP